MTGTQPAASSGAISESTAAAVNPRIGAAAMCCASVTIARRASTHAARTPACSSAAATSRLLASSPTDAIASRAAGEAARRITVAPSRISRSSNDAVRAAQTGAASSTSASTASRCRAISRSSPLRTASRSRCSADVASPSSASVTPDIAETTTTAGALDERTMRTSRRMAAASPTEVPPNFMTIGRRDAIVNLPAAARRRASVRRSAPRPRRRHGSCCAPAR